MKLKTAAAACALMVASLAGCASTSGPTLASARANPVAACAAQIHAYFPTQMRNLDKQLRQHVWFNSSVTGVTLNPSRDHSGNGGDLFNYPICGATLHLADGQNVRGSFTLVYNGGSGFFSESGDNGFTGIAWTTSRAWNERVTRDYWIAKYGRKEFDRRTAAFHAWAACGQSVGERGLYDPRFLPGPGYDASRQMIRNDVDSARLNAEDEVCGMQPPHYNSGWDGDLYEQHPPSHD